MSINLHYDKSTEYTYNLMRSNMFVHLHLYAAIEIKKYNDFQLELIGCIVNYTTTQKTVDYPNGGTYAKDIVEYWNFVLKEDMKSYVKNADESLIIQIPFYKINQDKTKLIR